MRKKILWVKYLACIITASLGGFCWLVANKYSLIPIFNNIFLVCAYFFCLFPLLYLSFRACTCKLKTLIKILLAFFSIVVTAVFAFLAAIIVVFSLIGGGNFSYAGKTYYYQNEGFPKPIIVIYEQDTLFTMREINACSFMDFPQKVNQNLAKKLVNGSCGNETTFPQTEANTNNNTKLGSSDNSVNAKTNNNTSNSNLSVKVDTELENSRLIANSYNLTDAIRIANSDFAIVAVDKAAARNSWFFVKIAGKKLTYISELPATSNYLQGRVEGANIYLTFQDINGNHSDYRSIDAGKTWQSANTLSR